MQFGNDKMLAPSDISESDQLTKNNWIKQTGNFPGIIDMKAGNIYDQFNQIQEGFDQNKAN